MDGKALFSWSGGKDSALALYETMASRDYDIVSLVTTVTSGYDRISMHGVRSTLLDEQADSLGLGLEKVLIPQNATNEEYELSLEKLLLKYKDSGVDSVVYGDIFLEEIRRYREEHLRKLGMLGVFPVWDRDSATLARTFIDEGFKAVVVCVDSTLLDGGFAGREFDNDFLTDLPTNADPCGENGEFHTFVYNGPIFGRRVEFEKGEIVLREGRFYYCELLPR
ncbi:MAG: diphthine--ammonia ligase [Thermodesulfobacteriota bacterium]